MFHSSHFDIFWGEKVDKKEEMIKRLPSGQEKEVDAGASGP